MKKILLLIDNLDSGGAQNQMVLLAQGLLKEGFKPVILSYFAGSGFFKHKLESKNIDHVLISKKGKIGFNVIKGLKDYIQKEEISTAISFMNTPNSYLAMCKFFYRLNIQIIISHRMSTDLDRMFCIRKFALKWVNNMADHIVCNSNHERENWLQHQPKIKAKIHTIYNGVDDDLFKPPGSLRKRNRRLLVVGSLSQFKNGLLVLKAIKNLKEDRVDPLKLIWIVRIFRIKFSSYQYTM